MRDHARRSAATTISPTPPSSCWSSRRSAPTPPRYGHLPLLHGPDGKKLSKRHGAASVQELRDAGYLPAPCATTWRCSAGARATTRRSSRPRSWSRASTSRGVQRNPAQFDEHEAALAERPLHARAEPGGADRGARGASTAATGCGPAAAISAEKLQTLADFWPLCGFIYDGPVDDPAARERWLGEDGRAVLARGPRRARGRLSRSMRAQIEAALAAVVERRGAQAGATSTSRCASRSPAARCRRASSRRSRCSGARRRSRAWTERAQLPERPVCLIVELTDRALNSCARVPILSERAGERPARESRTTRELFNGSQSDRSRSQSPPSPATALEPATAG